MSRHKEFLKFYYYRLRKNMLEVYRTEKDIEPKYAIKLDHSFIISSGSCSFVTSEDKGMYMFELTDQNNKTREFYHLKKPFYHAWMAAIKEVITRQKIVEDDYEMGALIHET